MKKYAYCPYRSTIPTVINKPNDPVRINTKVFRACNDEHLSLDPNSTYGTHPYGWSEEDVMAMFNTSNPYVPGNYNGSHYGDEYQIVLDASSNTYHRALMQKDIETMKYRYFSKEYEFDTNTSVESMGFVYIESIDNVISPPVFPMELGPSTIKMMWEHHRGLETYADYYSLDLARYFRYPQRLRFYGFPVDEMVTFSSVLGLYRVAYRGDDAVKWMDAYSDSDSGEKRVPHVQRYILATSYISEKELLRSSTPPVSMITKYYRDLISNNPDLKGWKVECEKDSNNPTIAHLWVYFPPESIVLYIELTNYCNYVNFGHGTVSNVVCVKKYDSTYKEVNGVGTSDITFKYIHHQQEVKNHNDLVLHQFLDLSFVSGPFADRVHELLTAGEINFNVMSMPYGEGHDELDDVQTLVIYDSEKREFCLNHDKKHPPVPDYQKYQDDQEPVITVEDGVYYLNDLMTKEKWEIIGYHVYGTGAGSSLYNEFVTANGFPLSRNFVNEYVSFRDNDQEYTWLPPAWPQFPEILNINRHYDDDSGELGPLTDYYALMVKDNMPRVFLAKKGCKYIHDITMISGVVKILTTPNGAEPNRIVSEDKTINGKAITKWKPCDGSDWHESALMPEEVPLRYHRGRNADADDLAYELHVMTEDGNTYKTKQSDRVSLEVKSIYYAQADIDVMDNESYGLYIIDWVSYEEPKPPQTKASILKQIDDRIKQGRSIDGGDFNDIDISGCTDMSQLFYYGNVYTRPYPWVRNFNGDISAWDVSEVTDMHGMFSNCESFNQPLYNWNVSNVTDMSQMFMGCAKFEQNLYRWNVSNVIDMAKMFYGCKKFNQHLNNWNVSKVTNISHMFYSCYNFNQPLNNWNVSKVTNMESIFAGCRIFNQNLDSWNVSSVTDMKSAFNSCPTKPSWYKG